MQLVFLARMTFNLIKAQKHDGALGYVGLPSAVDISVISALMAHDMMPVAPTAMGDDGMTYNINADSRRGVCRLVKGKRLLLLSDVPGINDKDGKLISRVNLTKAQALIDDGTVTGGMIPKLETCAKRSKRGRSSCYFGWRAPVRG